MIAVEEADEDEKSRIDAGRDGRLYTFSHHSCFYRMPPLPLSSISISIVVLAVLGRQYAGRERKSPSQSCSCCTMKGIGRETESSTTSTTST